MSEPTARVPVYINDNADEIYAIIEARYTHSPDIRALYWDALFNPKVSTVRMHVLKDIAIINAELSQHNKETAELFGKTAWANAWTFPGQVDWFDGDDPVLMEEMRRELVDVIMLCGTKCRFHERDYVVVYVFLDDESYGKPLRPDAPIIGLTLAPVEYIL
jgi:hypothetical protein